MLWTPIILVCSAVACSTASGPAFQTEQECYISLMEQGIPSMANAYGKDAIVDVKCIQWDHEIKGPNF